MFVLSKVKEKANEDGVSIGVEMSECYYCLSKNEGIFLVLLPVLIVFAWGLIERWINK